MTRRLIDLSQDIITGAPVYPGHPKTEVIQWDTHESILESGRFAENVSYETEVIHMNTHGPTHVDSISHVDPNPGAPSIDKIPLEWFYTDAICLDLSHIPPKTFYTVEMIEEALNKDNLDIRKGDTVLLYSGHFQRTWPRDEYITEYPGLDYESAKFIFEHGAVSIGQDAPSIDCAITKSYPAHQLCRSMQRLNIENLGDLKPVAGKRFQYIGLPLKILKGSGSPIRAIAVLEG
jgi:kynurenine formamidase